MFHKKKKTTNIEGDVMAIRYMGGLILIAFGVLLFMGLALQTQGRLFDSLRDLGYGLAGSLALLLPILCLWAGVLIIYSAFRKPPFAQWCFAMLTYIGVSTLLNLWSRAPSGTYMSYLEDSGGTDWSAFIRLTYTKSASLRSGGGALGMMIAWPLWRTVGNILGGIIVLLLTIYTCLMALHLSPKRLREILQGKRARYQETRQKERQQTEEQQIAWQQQRIQEAEQQRQWQQIQMQQKQQAQQTAEQYQAAAPMQARMKGYAQVSQPMNGDGGISEWQQQGAQQQNQESGSQQASRIFSKAHTNVKPEAGSTEKKERKSRLFHRQQEYDGLSDYEDRQGVMQQASTAQNLAQRSEEEAYKRPSRPYERPVAMDEQKNYRRPKPHDDAIESPADEDVFSPRNGRIMPGQSDQNTVMSAEASSQIETEENKQYKTETTDSKTNAFFPFSASQPAMKQDAVPFANDHASFAGNSAQQQTVNEEVKQDQNPAVSAADGERAMYRQSGNRSEVKDASLPAYQNVRERKEESFQAEKADTISFEHAEAPVAQVAETTHPATSIKWDAPVSKLEMPSQPETAKPAKALDDGMSDASASKIFSREPAGLSAPLASPKAQQIGADEWQAEVKLPPKREEEDAETQTDAWVPKPYHHPPVEILKQPAISADNTAAEDEMRSRRLEETLASFRVQAHVVNVTHGPAISRFELELAAGTKVGKITELEKDIAYGMEATSVRIEAPIPGKSLVGVEVPNRRTTPVTLREVLESEKMRAAKSILTVALGKDIAGAPIVCDLSKMPHLLIAGATGSGKSVCINAIINSLLFRAGPDEVKMILVDPKVVELQCYNGIPHLLLPVVNDPHKAAAALAWAVAEMMERYDKFAERRVRNLDGYNESLQPGEKPMPRIVVIIDELADLMMVCKKDVEEYICRLTQLARAAGIHLIVATQRPSVDVITGLIKANIPSRIAFKTASYVDSRTILDRNGSEQLLGYGDMLYLPTGSFAPTRVQGCFLSDDEVNNVVAKVRSENPSSYDPDILEKVNQLNNEAAESVTPDVIGGMPDSGGNDQELFQQAVEYTIEYGQISTSTLQRRLKVGYARAGRLTDELEERGIVSAKDGSKPRKCLITREQWEEMKKTTEDMA